MNTRLMRGQADKNHAIWPTHKHADGRWELHSSSQGATQVTDIKLGDSHITTGRHGAVKQFSNEAKDVSGVW